MSMMRMKYRQDPASEGRLITLSSSRNAGDSFMIKKEPHSSFPRVHRVSSQPKILTSSSTNNMGIQHPDDSFSSSVSRKRLIRNVYTPSQQNQLNKSMGKLFSASKSSRLHANNNNNNNNQTQESIKQSANSSRLSRNASFRQASSKQQVRDINRSVTPKADNTPQLRTLSKLVDFNLYKNQHYNNKQICFDQNRLSSTNSSLVKVRNMSHSISQQSFQKPKAAATAAKKKSFNQPQIAQNPQLVEVSGNSVVFSNKRNPFSDSTPNTKAPYLLGQNSVKSFMYGNEKVQLKNNKIIREKDRPRYANKKFDSNKLPNIYMK